MRVRVLRYLVATSVLLASACAPDGPRQLPFPTFDAKEPFPELTAPTGNEKGESEGAAGDSNYEKAIAESMEAGEREDEEGGGEAQTVKRQDVPLAGTLVSSVPLEFDEWQWSSQGDVTIITHREPGASQPDALVYVEGFSPLIRMFPSVEIRRFQQTVDPNLGPSLALPGLTDGLMGELSEQTGVDVGRLSEVLTRAASHTMGMGLNYRSGEDTFTGWQWVGHNEARVELRLGRTEGAWSSRPIYDRDISSALSQVTEQVSGLSGMQTRYNEVLGEQASRKASGWPAWMLLGSAVVERDRGLHIAMVCKTTPTCPVAGELSELLANIRPADAATVDVLRDHGSKTSLPDFAKEQGLPFVEGDKLLQPDEIGEQLRKALGE